MAQPYAQPCDDGVIRSEPCPKAEGREVDAARRPWVLAACVLASSMAFIDGSALTVALPALRSDFSSSLGDLQWVLNGYILALAAFTLIGGAVSDRAGRARTLVLGCGVFAAASVACAISPSLEWLIFARIVQGLGAAIMTPASLALIGETYPEEERGAAIGVWAAASALTTAGGPLLGGWLTDTFGWEAVFWMNPPIAAVAIIVLYRVGLSGHQRERRLDLLGSTLLAATLAALAFGLSSLGPGEGGMPAPDPPHATQNLGPIALAVSVVLAAVFWVQQIRSTAPMLPMEVIGSRDFKWLNVATLLLYGGLSVMFFVLPFHLIDGRGLSATHAGLMLLPFTLSVGLLSRLIGGIADQIGARPVMIAGSLLAALGHASLAILSEAGLVIGVLVPMGLLGVGFAALVAPLTASVMASVDEDDAGLASGINNTASRIAQLLGVAAAAAIAPLATGYEVGMVTAAALCVLGGAAFLGIGRRADGQATD